MRKNLNESQIKRILNSLIKFTETNWISIGEKQKIFNSSAEEFLEYCKLNFGLKHLFFFDWIYDWKHFWREC
jgi:hypothetical protein